MIKPCAAAVLLLSLVPAFSAGAEKEDSPASAYSDEDLQGYGEAPGNTSSSGDTKRSKDRQIPEKEKKQKEAGKQYWCKQGTLHRERVEKAKDKVEEAEGTFSERERDYFRGTISSSRYKTAKSNLEKARSELEKAERDLSDVENEAHRKWIPPGWLRCQFE